MAFELGWSEPVDPPPQALFKHAPFRPPQSAFDSRSVGELLRDADYLARQLLLDVTDDKATAMLRAWGEVVEAAHDLWHALPAGAELTYGSMARLKKVSDGIQTSVTVARRPRSTRWPGDGPTDDTMTSIAATFTRAADLAHRHTPRQVAASNAGREDLAAARMRVMHSLYLTAHAVGVGLHAYGRGLQRDSRSSGQPIGLARRRSPYLVHPVDTWHHRITVCENIAAGYIKGRFAVVAEGEHVPLPQDPSRLAQALADWDIQAHRTLVKDPRAANLLLTCRTQALIVTTGIVLLDAAATTGVIDRDTYLTRTLGPLETSCQAWSGLAQRWTDLTVPGERTDPALRHAAGELRAAVTEAAHDTTTWATADIIATRVDLATTIEAVHQALNTAVDVAHLVHEISTRDDLAGPARALSIRAHNDTEQALLNGARILRADQDPDSDIIWVSPRDVLANLLVPLPEPVVVHLADSAATALDAATTAASASIARTSPGDVAIVNPLAAEATARHQVPSSPPFGHHQSLTP